MTEEQQLEWNRGLQAEVLGDYEAGSDECSGSLIQMKSYRT
jgi:hypothetical protein